MTDEQIVKLVRETTHDILTHTADLVNQAKLETFERMDEKIEAMETKLLTVPISLIPI